jgi:hypothetical protein
LSVSGEEKKFFFWYLDVQLFPPDLIQPDLQRVRLESRRLQLLFGRLQRLRFRPKRSRQIVDLVGANGQLGSKLVHLNRVDHFISA